jgi:CubicO group peptidase (beta-lactamase class C family)
VRDLPPATPPAVRDWSAVDARLASFVPATVRGLAFTVVRGREVLHTVAFGDLTPTAVLPIASATKMPSGVLILALRDRGVVDLDRPVGEYLRGAIDWPADKAAVTLRMLLNHTSGVDGDPACLNNQQSTSLRACAQEIARAPLEFAPGTRFGYGGGSFHIAGAVAEAVTGRPWNDLFRDLVGTPLGLTRFSYGATANPRIAGGASSDVADYARLLQLMLNDGVGATGARVLSPDAVATLRTDQVAGIPKIRSPGGTTLPGYSFGYWISDPAIHPGSTGPELSDQGAFGATPWVDLGAGYAAVLLIQSRTSVGTEIWNAVRPLVLAAVRTGR